ncbi:hypothetical protein NZA98_25520, partial [Escherichia coli]|nr:hypothetical protein [Escherichia coli]
GWRPAHRAKQQEYACFPNRLAHYFEPPELELAVAPPPVRGAFVPKAAVQTLAIRAHRHIRLRNRLTSLRNLFLEYA